MLKWSETEETRFKGFKDYELQRLDRDILGCVTVKN